MSFLTRVSIRHDPALVEVAGQSLLGDLPAGTTSSRVPAGEGLFLSFPLAKPAARGTVRLGRLLDLVRFTCCHREEPFWLTARSGTTARGVPWETAYFLGQTSVGTYVLLVPLVDVPAVCTLQGSDEDVLDLAFDTGDPAVRVGALTGLFIDADTDPYVLLERSAEAILLRDGFGRLRKQKSLPSFVDQFGWCTWDAFYEEVTGEKVLAGLQTFSDGGVRPTFLILDDGWLSFHPTPTGGRALSSFEANSKFPGGLRPLTDTARHDFGVKTILAWHALPGYWGGVDAASFPQFTVRTVPRDSTPGILKHKPNFNEWWGGFLSLVSPDDAPRFFQDFHRTLRAQGIDGVKVDVQAVLESGAHGSGGRVHVMRRFHEALEGSVAVHFNGALINCMSCAPEMLYGAPYSNVTRTSIDFWPNKPESHGLHVYVNAQVSAWFGHFIHPDWDMFQSGHPAGAFHAAARAVSGGPVYVSDKPGTQNFDLLKKLVLPDGSTPRCIDVGRPTRDCLLHDATCEPMLLKIFNYNRFGGVVGVFNCRFSTVSAESLTFTTRLKSDDLEWSESPEGVAVYLHQRDQLAVLKINESIEVALSPLEFEVATVVPIKGGFAPIGLTEYLNAGGLITSLAHADHVTSISLSNGGDFTAYCEYSPARILVDGEALPFAFDESSRTLRVTVPRSVKCELMLQWT